MSPYLAGGILAFYIASCALCFHMGDKYETADCTAADNAHDLVQSQNTVAAEKKVISIVQTQGNISQETSNAYAKTSADIISMYASVGVPVPTNSPINGMSTIRSTAGRTGPDSCKATTSKKYKLTPEQCDQEEAKCNELWNWADEQAHVK